MGGRTTCISCVVPRLPCCAVFCELDLLRLGDTYGCVCNKMFHSEVHNMRACGLVFSFISACSRRWYQFCISNYLSIEHNPEMRWDLNVLILRSDKLR